MGIPIDKVIKIERENQEPKKSQAISIIKSFEGAKISFLLRDVLVRKNNKYRFKGEIEETRESRRVSSKFRVDPEAAYEAQTRKRGVRKADKLKAFQDVDDRLDRETKLKKDGNSKK